MDKLLQIFSNIDFAGTAVAVTGVVGIIISVIIYGCKAIGLYLLSAKNKQKYTWMSFIPVLQDIKVFNMAGLSTKAFIVFYCVYRALLSAKLEVGIFLPLAYLGILIYYVGLFYARYQMAKNFGCSQALCILHAIFEPFTLLYIVAQKMPHQYTPQHPKVDHYLKAYALYEDPAAFIDPKATGRSIFDKDPAQAPQQPQAGQAPNNNWYQQAPQNPDMGAQIPPNGYPQDNSWYQQQGYQQQNPQPQGSPVQVDVNKDNSSGININIGK